MSSPYDERIEELLAQYRDARDQAVETRLRINEVEATVEAPRKVVKVTVGAQGQVKALDFPTGAFRDMPPKDLSRVIVTTLEKARAKVLEQVSEVSLGGVLKGVSLADLMDGRVDPRSILPEQPRLPDMVEDYVEHGLGRDEGGRKP